MTIFIGNLSWDTEEEDLKDLFNTYGEVTNVQSPQRGIQEEKEVLALLK